MGKSLRVIVIEDEMTIALLIEDMLIELGHEVVGTAMRLSQALELARTAAADYAILDVNLDGRMSYPVADILSDRGVPFAFASGYGPTGLDARFVDCPVLTKPFNSANLAEVLKLIAVN